MNEHFDVLIIGAGSSGAYTAKLLAEKGHSVCVIDSLKRDKIGTKYDIVHIEEKEFKLLNIPRPVEGDAPWAFEFSENLTADPLNLYPKKAINPIVGVHMHEYTLLLNFWAENYGAQFRYDVTFESFVFENGKIVGAIVYDGKEHGCLYAKTVIDCSGINAVGRRELPDHYGIENFALSDEDMFYVILKYVKLKNESDFISGSCGWPYFKGWIAPCADPEGAIIGIGACHGFDYAESMYETMEESISFPKHDIVKIEKGRTPYTRPPFSFVADNFIVSGDAACLTKPLNGEGITSSMPHQIIVADVLSEALYNDDTCKKALWRINTEYNHTQGAEFAFLRALLVGIVNAATFDEFEYAFSSGMISDELLSGEMNAAAVGAAVRGFLSGVARSKVNKETVKASLNALKNASEAQKLYKAFPDDPLDYFEWVYNARKLWEKIGKIK